MKHPLTLLLIMCSLTLYAPPNNYSDLSWTVNRAMSHYKTTAHKNALLKAMVHVESRNNPATVNTKENAVGILQCRPIMLNEVNRIVGYDKYSLHDRTDPVKSVEMWRIVMDYWNPDYGLKSACLIWNGRGKDGNGSLDYYNKVKNNYHENISAKTSPI